MIRYGLSLFFVVLASTNPQALAQDPQPSKTEGAPSRVVDAPDASLALSSLIALHDWRYQPYLLNGHPVEVHTEVKVIFQLGR